MPPPPPIFDRGNAGHGPPTNPKKEGITTSLVEYASSMSVCLYVCMYQVPISPSPYPSDWEDTILFGADAMLLHKSLSWVL